MNRPRLERRLRLGSGIAIAVYVIMHLFNHAAGVLSVDAMERVRPWVASMWQSVPGTVVLYGALALHVVLALRVLYRRSTLRLPAWELAQIGLGLAIPLMLVGHVIGTRVNQTLTGFDVDYPYIVAVLWSDPWYRVKQPLLLLIVWAHLCVGLHFAFRIRGWYHHAVPYLYALALLLPSLAIVGFVRAGLEMEVVLADSEARAAVFSSWRAADPSARAMIIALIKWTPWGIAATIGLVLALRWGRMQRAARRPRFTLQHPEAGAVVGVVGTTVLEALRAAKVPHASVCGARGRCTTCRVRVDAGLAELAAPGDAERVALARIAATERVRLACQIRPSADLTITPLLPSSADVRDAYRPGGVSGREQPVVAMFVDLRASTGLGEKKLPYDVVFILNQFFTEMSLALEATGGHYAQFAGDGLLALYGLEGPIERGCRDALRGAAEMMRRLDALNVRLGSEIDAPLRIGIGVHSGDAIVGTMGPPTSPLLSAIGDNINIAARLEALSKSYECILVVSAECIRSAGADLADHPTHEADVRGRHGSVTVYAVGDPRSVVVVEAG